MCWLVPTLFWFLWPFTAAPSLHYDVERMFFTLAILREQPNILKGLLKSASKMETISMLMTSTKAWQGQQCVCHLEGRDMQGWW